MELSKWQKRFWLDSLVQQGNAANVAMVFTVQGRLNIEALVEAVRMIVAEIESMHCVCKQTNTQVEWVESKEKRLNIEVYENGEKKEEYWELFGQRLFCLVKDFPLRLLVVKYEPESYKIEFVFHHICMDLVSLSDFWQLLSDKYASLLTGEQMQVKPKPSLVDYLVWEKENLQERLMQEGLQYWQQFIDTLQPGCILPTGSGKAGCIEFKLGIRLQQRVQQLAKQLETTSFRVLMNAWLWTLSVYSGNRCPVVSYAVNVRPSELKGLIAPFVNNLPWGMSLENSPSFRQCIVACNEQRRRARQYQGISITEIMEVLRKADHSKVNDSFLNMAINYAPWGKSQQLELLGTRVIFERRIVVDSYFDLTLEIEPEEPGHGRLIYKDGLERKMVRGMQQVWVRTLIEICRNPEIRFGEIDLLTPKKKCLLRWRSGEMILKTDQKFIHFLTDFRRIVVEYGDKVALCLPESTMSYRELDSLSNYIAWRVSKESWGKPVGVCLKRDCNYIAVLLGIMKAGRIYVPLDFAYPPERLQFMTKDSGIRLVVTQKKLAGLTGSSTELYIEDLLVQEWERERFSETVLKVENLAYIIYTSGTTGKPKGVPINYGNLCCLIRNAIHWFRLTSRSVQLQYANLAFDASVMEIFPALSVGATLCLVPEDLRKNPVGLLDFIRQQKVSSAYIAPAMLAQMEGELPALKVLFVGGESTSLEVIERWRRGRRLLNLYGPTECTVFATAALLAGKTVANDIGAAVKGVCGYVVDEYGRLLPEGVPGELCLGGWQLTSGYLNREELNQKKFIQLSWEGQEIRLYRTGDKVVELANGHFLFLGRMDSQVKIRGNRIELGEIENVLNQIDGIRQALVEVKGEQEQKRLVAYVQPKCSLEVDVDKWRDKLAVLLPVYMQPATFVVMDTFPFTPNGKVDRMRLPEPEWTDGKYVGPETVVEQALAKIVEQILGIRKISVVEDLFAWGLSSLTAVVLSTEATKVGISLPVAVIYREKNIRNMADACGGVKVCHWYTPFRERYPIVVLICGHMDFGAMLRPLAEELKQRYSVLVIESFHDYYTDLPEGIDFQGILAYYEQIISKIIPSGKMIYAFTGHCFGGEIAYALAVRWAIHHVERPEVWMFNSLAFRKMPENWMQTRPLISSRQKMLWELALHKEQAAQKLISTAILPTYTGRVILFIPTRFTSRLVGPDLPDLADIHVIKYMKEVYKVNPENWAFLTYRLEVYKIEGDHWTMMKLLKVS